MKSREIVVPAIAAIISLICTFILFKFLESYSSGSNTFMGGDIKYGGALGGFVLIFWLIMRAYYSIVRQHEQKTTINIDGQWETETTEHVADGSRKGVAFIRQQVNDPTFYVTMELEEIDDPQKKLTINTLIGYIKDTRIIWVYETSDRKIGIAMANAHTDKPEALTMKYYDSIFDTDKVGRHGSVNWVRKMNKGRRKG